MTPSPSSKTPNEGHHTESITLQVKDFEANTGSNGEKKDLAGVPWWFNAYRDDEVTPNAFCALVRCYKDGEKWNYQATVNIQVVNVDDSTKNIYKSIAFNFTSEKRVVCEHIINWSDIFDASKGFLKNGVITVKIHFRFGEWSPFAAPRSDFLCPSRYSSVILLIEDKKLYLSKEILAHHSYFFEALFFGDFKEANQSEIRLEDIEYEEFLVILHLIYDRDRIGENNIDIIQKLADRFEMTNILSEAEHFLIDTKNVNLPRKILLADRYNLKQLMDSCMGRITSAPMIREIKRDVEYSSFSDGMKDKLFEKLLEMSP